MSHIIRALDARRYTKLILGASFTDLPRLEALIRAYVHTGIQCIDISAKPEVVSLAAQILEEEGRLDDVTLMVSFPLDEDPHFRKIQLDRDACIDCSSCLSVCPTEVFSMPEGRLSVAAPQCYGCNRCVPICPTEALSLDPFSVMSGLAEALSHPAVSAVEVHSTYADPALVELLYESMGSVLAGKLVSVCFRPQVIERTQAVDFIQAFASRSELPVLIQVDGKPMSATDDIDASLPALDAASSFAQALNQISKKTYLTVSGGINAHTAELLKLPQYQAIQGVGLGTTARTWVWNLLDDPLQAQEARKKADTLISVFHSQQVSDHKAHNIG